jgi:hypothetical protein
MKNGKWEAIVLSDGNYDYLVAELIFDGAFLLLLDREQGRDLIHVAFAKDGKELGPRILLKEFIENLQKAADDLCR